MAANLSKRIKFLNNHLPWLFVVVLTSGQSQLSGENMNISFFYSDKVAHFLIFGVLGWLLARAIFKEENTFLQQNYFLIILFILAIYAMLDEIHQYYIPGRSLDIWDWVADMSGVTLFLLIFKIRNQS